MKNRKASTKDLFEINRCFGSDGLRVIVTSRVTGEICFMHPDRGPYAKTLPEWVRYMIERFIEARHWLSTGEVRPL